MLSVKRLCAVGTCTALALLSVLSTQAADLGNYFKIDAGISLPMDMQFRSIGGTGFPSTMTVGQLGEKIGIPVPAGQAGDVVTFNKPKFEFDPGVRVDVAVGHRFSEALAVELEAGFAENAVNEAKFTGTMNGVGYDQKFSINNVNLWQVPVLVNGIYTFNVSPKLKPFVGAGAGGIYTLVETKGSSRDDFTFAYQGQAGVDYLFTDTLSLGLTYKFLGTLDHDFGGVRTEPIYTHSILAALTLRF